MTPATSDCAVGQAGPVLARAKVNLWLHVTGRRGDGYHEIESLVVRMPPADRLWFARGRGDRLTVTGPFAGELVGEAPTDNLVMRAIERVRAACGSAQPFETVLDKAIPVAAGLGGGSADAAATLKALSAMLGGPGDLRPLADALGCDVGPCLRCGAVTLDGGGEPRAAGPLPGFALVLVNPRRRLPTRDVFAAHDAPYSAPAPLSGPIVDFAGLAGELAARRNDLEAAACRLAPVVGDVLHALRRCREVRVARMSGSGATCFGLTASLREAQAAAARIRERHPSWWTRAAEFPGDA